MGKWCEASTLSLSMILSLHLHMFTTRRNSSKPVLFMEVSLLGNF